MKLNLIKRLSLIAGVVLLVLTSSCSAPKNIAYFQDLQTTTFDIPSSSPIVVRPGDKLSIVVNSPDPSLSVMFNLNVNSPRLTQGGAQSAQAARYRAYEGTSAGMSYYTVTPDGKIDFPVLGYLNVKGMTRSELAGFIKGELMGRNLVKNPQVTVEFINVGVNVLGEVRIPGRYDINTDDLTVIDVLALAGDINIRGRRDNVLVMRKTDGKIDSYRLDLTNTKELIKSPGYYLQQDDIVYVEPNNAQKRSATVNGTTALSASFWVSIASVLTSMCVLIFK